MTIQPKQRFIFENPRYDLYDFLATVDEEYEEFIEQLPYVQMVLSISNSTMIITIDQRYDLDEAWLDLHDKLTLEYQLREVMETIPG